MRCVPNDCLHGRILYEENMSFFIYEEKGYIYVYIYTDIHMYTYGLLQ